MIINIILIITTIIFAIFTIYHNLWITAFIIIKYIIIIITEHVVIIMKYLINHHRHYHHHLQGYQGGANNLTISALVKTQITLTQVLGDRAVHRVE